MGRNRGIRAAAGVAAAGMAVIGLVAATADERMAGGMVAAAFFTLAALSGLAVAASALVPSIAAAAQPIAASAGVLLAFVAIGLVPLTAVRSACACTQLPPDQVPPPASVAGIAAPHDVLFVAAVGAPLLLLLAANVGRGGRRPAELAVTDPWADDGSAAQAVGATDAERAPTRTGDQPAG